MIFYLKACEKAFIESFFRETGKEALPASVVQGNRT